MTVVATSEKEIVATYDAILATFDTNKNLRKTATRSL